MSAVLRLRNACKFSRRVREAAAIDALILFTSVAAFALINTGEIVGVVRDGSGGGLPGLSVTATAFS